MSVMKSGERTITWRATAAEGKNLTIILIVFLKRVLCLLFTVSVTQLSTNVACRDKEDDFKSFVLI